MKNSLHNLLEVVKGPIGRIVLSALLVALAFVWLPPVVSRGVKVSFDLRAERTFVCSAYFKEAERGPFRHVDTRVPAGSSKVQFLIPVANVKTLRIDYGARPGHVESGPVRVAGEREEVLDWKDFSAFNDIARRAILADGWLSLDSEGGDPYAVFGKDLNMREGRHFDFRGIVVRIFLLLAAVVGIFWRTRPIESVRAAVFRRGVQPVSEWFDAACRRSYDGFRSWLPDRSFAIYMVAVILLAWGFELFNFTFTSDDDLVLYGDGPLGEWLKEGRWGMYLLGAFYGNNSVPLFPLALTLFLYSLTFVILFGRIGLPKYFLFPVYVAFPVLYQSFSFSSLNPGVGIAFFLAACAVRLSEGGIVAYCVSVLLGAASIGCYQIFVFFMVIAVVIRCMERIYSADRFRVRDIAAFAVRGCCLVLLSYLAYKAIMHGFTYMTGIGENYIAKRYFNPPKSWAEWCAWAPVALKRVFWLLSGAEGVFPTSMWGLPILVTSGALVVVAWTILGGGRAPIARVCLFAGCVFLLALAFLPLTFNRSCNIPDRVIVLLIPSALVGVLSISARCIACSRIGFVTGAILCILCAFQFAWGMNQMAYSSYLQNRHDAGFVAMVRARVESLPEVAMRRFKKAPVPLLIVGRSEYDRRGAVIHATWRWRWPEWEHDHAGRPLLINPVRWRFAIKTYLGTDYDDVAPNMISKATVQFIENMPIWPLEGSVAWKDGHAIVKFSDFGPEPAPGSKLRLSRRLRRCTDGRINGFDELTCTDVDEGSLLHRYGDGGVLASASRNVGLTFKPYRTAEPYLILEFRMKIAQDSQLTLWKGNVHQECLFFLPGGSDVLRLRVPSEFLSVPLQVDLSSPSGAVVKVMDVNIYADRKYTMHLLELNPGLKDSLPSAAGGHVR